MILSIFNTSGKVYTDRTLIYHEGSETVFIIMEGIIQIMPHMSSRTVDLVKETTPGWTFVRTNR
jgi:hypothetical protein